MKDVFQVVTTQIIGLLVQGIVPWRRSWTAVGPTSYNSNKPYQGINTMLLQSFYGSPYWLTFRQAQKLGGSIKAGEHGRYIVFTDRMVKEVVNEKGEAEIRPIFFLRYYTVFNWEQTKGIPEMLPAEQDNATAPDAEELLHLRNPRIRASANGCFYREADDTIYLPGIKYFDSSEEYYSAAFHELTHWTGAGVRLNRPELKNYHQGRQVRSREELVAEMGAAFLCQLARLDTSETIKNSAAYIQSWIEVLESNPKWILQASKQAREAVEYVTSGKPLVREALSCAATATA